MADLEKEPSKFAKDFANAIVKQLEKGVSEWEKGWNTIVSSGRPSNFLTGNEYSGMNTLRLSLAQMEKGYVDHRWLTFNQAKQLGGSVKKGEKSTTIQFVRPRHFDKKEKRFLTEKEEKELKPPLPNHIQTFLAVKSHNVFNVEQTEGIAKLKPLEAPKQLNEIELHARAEGILKNSGANIQHAFQNRAYYSPSQDKIVLPEKGQFKSASHYYDTALHEMGHWTGHQSRLDRSELMKGGFGSESYAKEELRAEISSWMTASKIGLPHNTENHASYVGSWIKAIKENPNTLIEACRDAEKISSFILQFDKDKNKQDEEIGKHSPKNSAHGLSKADIALLQQASQKELKEIKSDAVKLFEQSTRLADRVTSKTKDIASFESQKVMPKDGGIERG